MAARRSIAFGIERIGLIPLAWPLAAALFTLVLSIAAAFGLPRIKVDDSLSQLFRSETPEFRQFEEVTRRFPSSEYDVLVVVEGKDLLERDSLEKLRDLVTDLQLVDGTRGIISLFSARQPPEGNRIPAPLFPEELPDGPEYDKLVERVMSNEIIRGKLLSEDGELALVVLPLDPSIVQTQGLAKTVGEIRKTVAEDLADTDLKSCLTRQSSELIYEILRWRHGRFRFAAGIELPPPVIDAALGLDVEAVLMEGYRRVDEWHLIERAIDNFDVVFLRNEDSVAQMGRGRLTREELAVLELVNGKNTVKDIIRKSRMGSFEVSKMLYRLLSIKLVRRRVLPIAV